MALTQAYVNEVLNHLPSTVVVDEVTWPKLIKLLKFEGRDLNELVIGQMKLREAKGGYEVLIANLHALLNENATLRTQVDDLTKQVADLTTPMKSVTEPVHG